MINNQLESEVRDWLIEHYANTDIRFNLQVRQKMFEEYPELVSEEHPSRKLIEEFCQKETALKIERKYFYSPLTFEEVLYGKTSGALSHLYQSLVSLMSRELVGKTNVSDNEQLLELWGNSLVVALLIKPRDVCSIFCPNEGFARIEEIVQRSKDHYSLDHSQDQVNRLRTERLDLFLKFIDKSEEEELKYFRGIHDSAAPRVPDARQKAEEYTKSIPHRHLLDFTIGGRLFRQQNQEQQSL